MFAKFRQLASSSPLSAPHSPSSSSFTELEPEPTELNPSKCGQRLQLSKDKLSVVYTGNGTHNNDVGAIQANRPAPTQRLIYYFEILVKDRGARGCIAVGFSDASFKTCRQPGWEQSSYGYHGDNGKAYHNSGRGELYGPDFTSNDVVGAGINYASHEIFFTKNGKSLGPAFRDVKGELFPTIGLHSPNERVEVNFGQKPFLFDVQDMAMDERAKTQRSIDRIPLSPHITHSVVRSYLLFYGYADTLAAFDAASNSLAESSLTAPAGAAADASAGAAAAAALGMANGATEPASLLGGPLSPAAAAARGGAVAGAAAAAAAAGGTGSAAGGAEGGREGSMRGRDMGSSGPEPMDVTTTGLDAAGASTTAGTSGGQDGAAGADAARMGSEPWTAALTGTLAFRAQVRQMIRAGHIDAALNKLFEALPQLLQNDSAGVTFLLRTSKFAEIVRSGSLESALAYARSELSGFRGRSPDQDALLEDFLALLAYPDASTSPLSYLLHSTHREAVADQVNAAILASAAASATHCLPSPPSHLFASGSLDTPASVAAAAAAGVVGAADSGAGAGAAAAGDAAAKAALDLRGASGSSSGGVVGSLAGAVGGSPGEAAAPGGGGGGEEAAAVAQAVTPMDLQEISLPLSLDLHCPSLPSTSCPPLSTATAASSDGAAAAAATEAATTNGAAGAASAALGAAAAAAAAAGDGFGPVVSTERLRSVLEVLLRQVAVAHEERREAAGGQGELFCLQRILRGGRDGGEW